MKEEDKIHRDDNLTQHLIAPNTGRDITGEYIGQRLKELEILAEKIIENALTAFKQNQTKKTKIYKKAYWEIHNKLGMGSIGPATAAAGPLMEEKKRKLANVLKIQEKDLL